MNIKLKWLMPYLGITTLVTSLFFLDAFKQTDTFAISTKIAAPTHFLEGRIAIVQYVIKNTSIGAINDAYWQPIAGATQDINLGPGFCSGPQFALSIGETCILQLSITTSIIGKEIVICGVQGTRCTHGDVLTANSVNTPENMPKLKVEPSSSVIMTPNQTQNFVITNLSTQVTANNVLPLLPQGLQQQMNPPQIDSACLNLGPGESCNIKLTTLTTALYEPLQAIVFEGANTYPTFVEGGIITQSLEINPITIAQPGKQSVTVTNKSNAVIEILNVGNIFGVNNVSIDSSQCKTIPALKSCLLFFDAKTSAYGVGSFEINYTYQNDQSQQNVLSTPVTVVDTILTINHNDPIKIPPNTSNLAITVVNEGPFIWQNPTIDLETIIPNLTLNPQSCTILPGGLDVGQTCDLLFTANDATVGANSKLDAAGTNAVLVKKIVTVQHFFQRRLTHS